MVFKSEGANGLVKRLNETFVTFGIPEEITSDGGPQFTAGATQSFLDAWKVHHRKTSVANPHANSRAEIGVKAVKRLLMDNIGPSGTLDTDKFQRAMLIYCNSIDPETKDSPALILFGRPIRDTIPIPLGRYCPHNTWKEMLSYRERALAKRHSREHEKWNEHIHLLQPLKVGDHVYIQNLVGNHPKRSDRTGVVVEVKQFHQYIVRIDGSGRVTLRNRQHLRKFVPFYDKPAVERAINITPMTAPVTDKSQLSDNPSSSVTRLVKPPVQTLPDTGPEPSVTTYEPRSPVTDLVKTPVQILLDKGPEPPVTNHDEPGSPTPYSAVSDLSPESRSPTRQLPVSEPRISIQPSEPSSKKIPRALARLLPHNQPGIEESMPLRPTRRTSTKD